MFLLGFVKINFILFDMNTKFGLVNYISFYFPDNFSLFFLYFKTVSVYNERQIKREGRSSRRGAVVNESD